MIPNPLACLLKYKSCENGGPMKTTTVLFVFFTSVFSTQTLAQQIGMACNVEEAQRISQETERAVLDRVRADMRAEGRVQASALGVDDRDCIYQATQKAQWDRQRAIEQCISQTSYFRSCAIQDQRVVGVPQRLQPLQGDGKFDERNSDENTCRITAQNRAVQDALNSCQANFGMGCRVASGPTSASHEVQRRRRFGIMGPKDDYHVCHSSASAIPNTSAQVQCTVEIVARVQF